MGAGKFGNTARHARGNGSSGAGGHGPLRGYGIARRIEPISKKTLQMNQGTIYLCLVRLVQKGFAWELGVSENHRKAKFHSMPKPGRKLAAETRDRGRVAGTIGRLLQMAKRDCHA
jgi:DNA-binding PadR family transcriptional regulator